MMSYYSSWDIDIDLDLDTDVNIDITRGKLRSGVREA
jgi:hypothetical protein